MKNLSAGSHIKVSRGFYEHHGIYDGLGNVIHYAGFSEPFIKECVLETSLEDFLEGCERFSIVDYADYDRLYSAAEVVYRAKQRIGENNYNLIFNNCEHFACWCITGKKQSKQVESVMTNATLIAMSSRIIPSLTSTTLSRTTTGALISSGAAIGINTGISTTLASTGVSAGAAAFIGGSTLAAPIAVPAVATVAVCGLIGGILGGLFD